MKGQLGKGCYSEKRDISGKGTILETLRGDFKKGTNSGKGTMGQLRRGVRSRKGNSGLCLQCQIPCNVSVRLNDISGRLSHKLKCMCAELHALDETLHNVTDFSESRV